LRGGGQERAPKKAIDEEQGHRYLGDPLEYASLAPDASSQLIGVQDHHEGADEGKRPEGLVKVSEDEHAGGRKRAYWPDSEAKAGARNAKAQLRQVPNWRLEEINGPVLDQQRVKGHSRAQHDRAE
jgi:hypothetical protein